ncbi:MULTISPECIES: Na+/H+ antiporter NhaA [Gordonia]|uniref:Na(+)/H(+) antiporter NhaA n=2 Tax=Gordonia alkanivorans TaxID=84096 RepID=F9VSS3_9ACTN|nr:MULTISPECIES: Na+/H+ antiporter NhaA [Gordonia]ETA06089.1 sodium:proton antiporter [Gordonia alkanivorans CGMCC 6845]MCZ4651778.1 Na+/H+ antiporter NhaA [Gordonia amicalis]UKO93581.1 Na+/H+ antiporter NhaA [Gordonia amicalis]WJG14699.1 Na+/H+ antiporter NhaA [Gordonia sp. Swx-4]GAA11662.1 Na(+)/H(+) antiporter NhaA [Gordonia alkanivorans NBRC 16433]
MTRDRLRQWAALDTTSGVLLLIAAAIAVVWANSPWRESYSSLLHTEIGPEALNLHLSLAHWASDGLLAIFFFVVGVELKHEFVAGSLRDVKLAGVPIAAAVGGMVTPALCYVVVVAAGDPEGLRGWAIPTATDIAFALAVLAIFGRGLPLPLRTFLLTLAVVDDLLGIVVIATFYTDEIDFVMLGGAIAVVAVFAVLVRRSWQLWPLLIPVGLVAWGLMHASGVHATVAGVLLGFAVPAVAIRGEKIPRTERLDEAVRPYSAAIALPVFAFAAAGVTVIGGEGSIVQPVSIGIVLGLVAGKLVGVLGSTWLMTRFTPLRLPDAIGIRDLLPIGMLTGVGFTVALLIAELSFEGGSDDHAAAAKAAILAGSLISAVLAAVLLRWDAHQARDADMNRDNIPDVNRDVIGG